MYNIWLKYNARINLNTVVYQIRWLINANE
ncbi:hypothetical protein BN2476_590070 [Paraburkholderia piptadeniae]|uniref:Uncharacterized protein n=1 Tax=Paraburkholderia piptadeniae TaxID=1701573 RepID=A0A1N7SJU0_9BURK|nr:hypothetical protein BN2476_590070 [Paraburkholderia piptadeniae]